jgi:hypothetical protein
MNFTPPSYQSINGYWYRLDRWHYSNDYNYAICEYIPDLDLPFIDQVVTFKFTVDQN